MTTEQILSLTYLLLSSFCAGMVFKQELNDYNSVPRALFVALLTFVIVLPVMAVEGLFKTLKALYNFFEPKLIWEVIMGSKYKNMTKEQDVRFFEFSRSIQKKKKGLWGRYKLWLTGIVVSQSGLSLFPNQNRYTVSLRTDRTGEWFYYLQYPKNSMATMPEELGFNEFEPNQADKQVLIDLAERINKRRGL